MNINTRYDIGQYVYFMKDNKVIEAQVLTISIAVKQNHYYNNVRETIYSVSEGLNPSIKFNESEIYGSKEELLESL